MRRLFMPALAVLSLVLLASCGGDGDNHNGPDCLTPAVPTPISPTVDRPVCLGDQTTIDVTFNWGEAANATSYEFYLYAGAGCAGTAVQGPVTGGPPTVIPDLNEGTYSWKVVAVNSDCADPLRTESLCSNFEVLAGTSPACECATPVFPVPPVINNPCSNTIASQNAVFTWNTLVQADGYIMRLYIGTGCEGSDDSWEEHLTTKARYQKKFLTSGGMYSWKVQAWGACEEDPSRIGLSGWSDCCNFQAFP